MSADPAQAIHDVDLVVLATIMIDLIGAGPTAELEGVETFSRVLGGTPRNLATTAVRLGRRTAVVARVGDDPFGRYIRAELRRRQILDNWLQVDPAVPSAVAFYAQSSTPRDSLIIRGADQYLKPDDETLSLIRHARAVHTTALNLAAEPCRSTTVEVLEQAHAAGLLVSFDPTFWIRVPQDAAGIAALLKRILPLTTIVKTSIKDAEQIWGPGLSPGDYIECFHERGAEQILLTLGKDGVIASDGRIVQRLPVVPIETTDTAGVGDAFGAGAISALLDGYDLFTAARVGMVVASHRLRSPAYSGPLPRLAVLIEQAHEEEAFDPALRGGVLAHKRLEP